jgi:hypothetical protein
MSSLHSDLTPAISSLHSDLTPAMSSLHSDLTPLGIYDIALKADTLQNMYLLGGNINNNLSSLKAFFYNSLG